MGFAHTEQGFALHPVGRMQMLTQKNAAPIIADSKSRAGRSPANSVPLSPRERGRMSHAPVAHTVANEANEQGSVTPKAAGDLCELRGAAQRARGLRGKGAHCLASLTHVFKLMPLPSGEGKSLLSMPCHNFS